MFITAGSCSVMLVCPTRRILFCHGSLAGSIAGNRRARVLSLGAGPTSGARTFSATLEAGSKALIAAAMGITPALAFRKVRRLSIGYSLLLSAKESLPLDWHVAVLHTRSATLMGSEPRLDRRARRDFHALRSCRGFCDRRGHALESHCCFAPYCNRRHRAETHPGRRAIRAARALDEDHRHEAPRRTACPGLGRSNG